MSFKIVHPLLRGTLKEVGNNIYALKVKDQYDRSMLFCRYQEFYESPYKKYRNKFFTLSDYMRYYTKKRNSGTFTYTEDWSGYNIPSHILEKALDKFIYKEYMTEYDKLMHNVYIYCQTHSFSKENVRKKFYLLGVENFSDDTFKHEFAHGLYYTNDEYKKNCDILISNIKNRHYNFVRKVLIKLGYSNEDKIIYDEMQAYFSTGLHDKFDGDDIREYQKPFIENFIKYSGKQKKEKT